MPPLTSGWPPAIYRHLLDALDIGIFVLDRHHKIVMSNRAFNSMVKVRNGTLPGTSLWKYFDEEKYAECKVAYDHVFATRQEHQLELVSTESGTYSELKISPWGEYVLVQIFDVTKHKEAETSMWAQIQASNALFNRIKEASQEAKDASEHDLLTGLYNRRKGEEIAKSVFRGMQMQGFPMSILAFDIDHFKRFNDTYGHAEGDNVLRLVSMSLKQTANGSETVARIGGEEFMVICPAEGMSQALERAKAFLAAIRAIDSARGPVTASIGVASLAPNDADWTSILGRSDRAMYAAKANGRDRIEVWTEDLTKSEDLRRAA